MEEKKKKKFYKFSNSEINLLKNFTLKANEENFFEPEKQSYTQMKLINKFKNISIT